MIITGQITRIYRKKKDKPTGKYVSRERMRAHGRLEIISVVDDPESELQGKEMPFEVKDRMLPTNIKKNVYVTVKGELEELTQKTKIIVAESISAISPSAVRELYQKKGINISLLRQESAIEKEVASLTEAFELGYKPKLAKRIYTQEIANIQELLEKGNIYYDVEVPHRIVSFYSRRAKARGYDSVSEMIEQNPLILAELEGFRLADVIKMAEIVNPGLSKNVQLYSKLISYVWTITRTGDSYAPLNKLAFWLKKDLIENNIPVEKHKQYITSLAIPKTELLPHKNFGKLVPYSQHAEETKEYYTKVYSKYLDNKDSERKANNVSKGIYLVNVFYAEKLAAKLLADMISPHTLDINIKLVNNLELDKYQKQAIKNVLAHRVSVIVGHAGSGKTHTISQLVKFLKRFGYNAIILAPSALAAAQAAYKVGEEISYSTIHRIARILPDVEDYGEDDIYSKENKGLIKENVIIVDECVMCNINTFSHLLHAISGNEDNHLVLVGDTAQLPSIGPSGFFHQLVECGNEIGIPVTELKGLYRAEKDDILFLATEVRKGKILYKYSEAIMYGEADDYIKVAKDLKEKNIELKNILFLSPTTLGKMGTAKINEQLRKIFNPEGQQIGNSAFYLDDPVVANKNDRANDIIEGFISRVRHPKRNIDVYNGTRGIIKKYEPESNTVWVEYTVIDKQELVPYTAEELSLWLDPAYALTVHKAQGGEADYVVLVVDKPINRNMMYTAITRARKKIYLLGKKEYWDEAVSKPVLPPLSKFIFRAKEHLAEKNKEKETKVASIERKVLFG